MGEKFVVFSEELGEVVGRVNEVHALLDEIEGMRL